MTGNLLLAEAGFEILAVQTGDVVDGDVLRALHLAGAGVGAVAEAEFVHLGDHGAGAAGGFRLALREQGEGADAGGHEQHGGAVLAGGDAGAATDASGGVHRQFGIIVRDEDSVGILRGAGADGDETAGLENLVKGLTIHDEVLDHREGGGAPRLHGDGGARLEVTHEQLAGGHLVVRTVGAAVHIQGAGAADALAAVMVEGDGLHALADELVIEDVQHLQEGGILLHVGDMIGLETTLGFGVLLTPHFHVIFHNRR